MRSTRSPSLETQSSFERLQQLVKKEGKSARNLVTWSVPVLQTVNSTSAGSRGRGKFGARRRPVRNAAKLSRRERTCRAAAEQFSGSALGVKEGSSSSKAGVQARYWRYLFDNLFRAVDELYRTCETDGSVIECQEVMMTLDACRKDFSALIERIEMERRLERFPENRPPGVAWEVRKTLSPSKSSPVTGGRVSGGVVRNLKAGLTWADRVRGKTVCVEMGVGEEREEDKLSRDREEENDSAVCEDRGDESCRNEPQGGGEGESNLHTGDEEEEADGSWNQILREYNEDEGRRRVSWADRCESPPLEDGPMVLADTPRSPGRAITLHQRLSSPSRKRPIEESKRMLEEKQVRAQRTRDRLVEEQRLRSKAEQEKVREAREVRESKTRAWREGMEEKLQKAEQLRESHLQEKRRKAQDEDTKVSEIAFINSLEAQNRKIQVLRRHQDHKARLADMAEGRARRREEVVAREEAAQERRRVLEEERRAKLRDLDERRRDQVAKIEQMKQERERAREEAAQEKARERERRLEARNTALQLSTVQLEKKIQTKQDESSRRHDQQLEHIKEKAAGSRHTSCEEAPCVVPYPRRKWCTLCSVPIVSDVYLQSHERGRRHQEAVARLPDDHAPLIITLDEENTAGEVVQDQLRSGRRRARKLRQRMAARWREREGEWRGVGGGRNFEHRLRLQRGVKELSRLLERASVKTGLDKTGLQQLDRTLSDVARILGGKTKVDQLCFQELGGVSAVTSLLGTSTETASKLPTKSQLTGVTVLQLACASQPHVCGYMLAANLLSVLVDLLSPLLPQQSPKQLELCSSLLSLLAGIISTVSLSPPPQSIFPELMDSVSYLVSVGIISSISQRLGTVLGPLTEPAQCRLVISAVNLLVAASAALHTRVDDVFSEKKDDPTSLTSALRETELVGLLRMLYAMLLHDGPPRHSSSPPPLPPHTLSISTASLRAINNFAILDLHMVQSCLGAEGVSLEFRHVSSYLMWHCSYHGHSDLLQELILAVGYFSVLNPDHQVFLQSGRSPTLLQVLCALPFEYFSNPGRLALLFPTLISACYQCPENRAILSQEISCQLLVSFLSSHLSHTLKPPTSPGSRNLMDVVYRFPQSCWQEALDFFSQ